jgi:spermidine synthase
MLPWIKLDTSAVPGGEEILALKRRGGDFSISLGRIELMNSRLSGSEEALATLTAERLAEKPAAKVLVGGLGMGFTLRAALAAYGPGARIDVSELVPAIVRWARGPMAELFGQSLDDPRVTIIEKDIGAVMKTGRWDTILLDVDNGPEGLTRESNDRLYTLAGLGRAHEALLPGGILAVWSAFRDDRFTRRLGQAGFKVEELTVRARQGDKGPKHTIWLATRG